MNSGFILLTLNYDRVLQEVHMTIPFMQVTCLMMSVLVSENKNAVVTVELTY